MEGTYPISLGKEEVGQVYVERQGLYYHFQCCCQLQSEIICKVTAFCAGEHINLGILVPSGQNYILTRRLPVKLFGSDTPEFWIIPKKPQTQEIYVDIYPEEPFRYIAKLETAYLDRRRGKPGIRFQTDEA